MVESVKNNLKQTIRNSQQPTSPVGFPILKLPPPPLAAPTGSI